MSNWNTRSTLLLRALDPNDQEAWGDFVSVYKGFIEVILKQLNVHTSHVEDLTQEILIRIWKYLKSFDPEGQQVRFRSWLGVLIRNHVITFWQKQNKKKETSFPEQILEEALPGKSDLEELIESEWEAHVTETALNKIRPHFSGSAISAFEQSLLGKSTNTIAESLEITPASVRTLRSRVRNRMIEEIGNIRSTMEL